MSSSLQTEPSDASGRRAQYPTWALRAKRSQVKLRSEMFLAHAASQVSGSVKGAALKPACDMDAWGSFLPRMVIEQLLECHNRAGPLPDKGDAGYEEIHGTTLEAAVLFADASGFTALTEKLAQRPNGAELMCQIMNRFFGAVIECIHRYCGDVIKFAGDSVFAVFEVGDNSGKIPRGRAPHLRAATARAASCACALHKELHNFVAWKDEGAPDDRAIHLSLHIGVGCGPLTLLHLGGHHGRCALAARPAAAAAPAPAVGGQACELWLIRRQHPASILLHLVLAVGGVG